MADLHGEINKYCGMLEKIKFSSTDKLYILGDVIDRGESGTLILYAMMNTPNIYPLIGNHESLALPVLKKIRDGVPFELIEKTRQYQVWALSGGLNTARRFKMLSKEVQCKLIDYIELFSIYEEHEVNGRRFHLSHTLPEFDPDTDIHDVSFLEFILGSADYDAVYKPGVNFITGHTPTLLIDPSFAGKIWYGNGHIAIDCGAAIGGRLGCICLETMEEYYV